MHSSDSTFHNNDISVCKSESLIVYFETMKSLTEVALITEILNERVKSEVKSTCQNNKKI